MDLLTAEKEIIARLKDQLNPKHLVRSFPENPSTFQFIHPAAVFLVRYQRSSYSTPEANGQVKVFQERELEWVVTVVHKHLTNHDGVYPLMESAKTALRGYTLPSFPEISKIRITGDGFVGENSGIWQYEITFSHSYPESET